MSLANLPGLDFQLGKEVDALRDTVCEFAQAEIAPCLIEFQERLGLGCIDFHVIGGLHDAG